MAAVTGTLTRSPTTVTSGDEVSLTVALSGDAGLTVVEVINRSPPGTSGLFDSLNKLLGVTGSSSTVCGLRLFSGSTVNLTATVDIALVMSDGQVVAPTAVTVTVQPGPLPPVAS